VTWCWLGWHNDPIVRAKGEAVYMTAHLYWASADFEISADIDFPYEVHMVAAGDFSGAGSAVLRGALSRVSGLPVPVSLDASGVTAFSDDAARAIFERSQSAARPLTVNAASAAAAELLGLHRAS
jgi:hypothetical protein